MLKNISAFVLYASYFFFLRSVNTGNEKLKPIIRHQFANINTPQRIISIFLAIAHAAYTTSSKIWCCIF
jgi:hypothetical protein